MNVSTNTTNGRLTSFPYEYREENEEDLYELITEYLLLSSPSLKINKTPITNRIDLKNELPLRASLFPHVAPYIEFQSHDGKARYFPQEIQGRLQWDLTSTTPTIVRRIVRNTGFRLSAGCVNWCGTWNEIMYTYSFSNLKSYQKVNHFPGSYEIGHKDRLCRNFGRLMLLHGKKRFDFVPNTYVLPNDLELLLKMWENTEGTNKKWIIKPAASSRGRGIKVISNKTQLLVTSIDPLRIYFYENGLVRFASNKYKDSLSTLNDRFMHLTNYSINKYSSDYTKNDNVDSCKGHKWSVKCLWNHLSYYNRLFDAWETAYGWKRNVAVHRLRELCNKKFHLKRHDD